MAGSGKICIFAVRIWVLEICPQAQSGDKLRVHKVPLPSIFPLLQDRKADMNTP